MNEIAVAGYQLGDLKCTDPDVNQTCSFDVIGEFDDTFNVSDYSLVETFFSVLVEILITYERLYFRTILRDMKN